MKFQRSVTEMSCDGCNYGMGRYKDVRELERNVEGGVAVLLYPHPDNVGFEEFHFHVGKDRDCLRYWQMNERAMRTSLVAREWDEATIDAFVARVCGVLKAAA